jgi:general secretion pathway protein D
VLIDRGLTIKFNDDVYLIAKADKKSKSSTVVGMGRTVDTIPNASQKIMQIVPILYGIKVSLRNTVMELADVSITLDVKQSALFVTGDYRNVSRALELIQLLDSPANRGRFIGLVRLVYSAPELYLNQISTLLDNEGIPNSINDPGNNNLVFVPLSQIGAVAVFAATKELLQRVQYWTFILDKPAKGDVNQYFVYHPKYARAQDIGESLTPLISAKASTSNRSLASTALKNKKDASGNSTGNLTKNTRTAGGSNDRITFVVDERSNALIFYTTGTEYRSIIGLVDRLDVLPKQVMLDIVVAEVTLTDQFQYGVKWAINNGLVGNAEQIGQSASSFLFDGGFSYIFDNGKGDNITANLSQSDTHVKVLSNPSILVRDGFTASLDIGTDIAIVSAVTEGFNDNDRVTTSTSYRKTGIKVSVTPTINAQGIVIMDIDESISNEVTAQSGGQSNNPNIFERNLTTAVVAESGQTIILGGLIDEKKTVVENKIPLLGDIPLLGNLFKSSDDQYNKTELVLMVTPRVISRTDQWDGMMSTFKEKLSDIAIE